VIAGILAGVIGALIVVIALMGVVIHQQLVRNENLAKEADENNAAWEKGMDEQSESYEQMLNTAFEDNEKALGLLAEARLHMLSLQSIVDQHESHCLPNLHQDIHG
jgi:hypothetical protein